MKFLPGLFGSRRADPSGAIGRATGGVYRASVGYLTQVGSWDTEKAVKDGYERVIWVFRCVDVIATNQASMFMGVKERSSVPVMGLDHATGKWVEDDRLWHVLNVVSNTYETGFAFRYRLSSQLLLSRKGAFVEKVRGRDGRVSELHTIPPHTVEPIPDPDTFVSAYRVTRKDGKVEDIPPERVIWIRLKPHPIDPYAQMTPLVAAGLATETDFFARTFNRNYLANDGRPGLLIGLKGRLNQDDAMEIKRRFSGGPSVAGQTTVVEIDDIAIQDLTGNPRDAQYLEAIKGSKEDIMLAFGVPESVMGNASGRTYDNADAERAGFWLDTMVPHCNVIGTSFAGLTEGGLTDKLVVAYDYNSIDVLQRADAEREKRFQALWSAGNITWDEYRLAIGRDPWDTPFSRAVVLSSGVIVGRDDADQKEIDKLHVVGSPSTQQAQVTASQQGALAGIAQARRQDGNIAAARSVASKAAAILAIESKRLPLDQKEEDPVLPDVVDAEILEDLPAHPSFVSGQHHSVATPSTKRVHPYAVTRLQFEAEMNGVLQAWTSRQKAATIDRLNGVNVRKHTRFDEVKAGSRPLDVGKVVSADRWSAEVVGDFTPILSRLARKEARRVLRELKQRGVLLTVPDAQIEAVTSAVLAVVEKSARNQSDRVARLIKQLDDQGRTLKQIDQAIGRTINTRSSWRRGLATYATTAVVEGVKTLAFTSAGSRVTRTWRTEHDERVRPTHAKVDGVARRGAAKFRVGSAFLTYPGDPAGPIQETAHCRCWQDFTVD